MTQTILLCIYVQYVPYYFVYMYRQYLPYYFVYVYVRVSLNFVCTCIYKGMCVHTSITSTGVAILRLYVAVVVLFKLMQ